MQNLQATRLPVLDSLRDSLRKLLALHHPHCLWFWKMSDMKYFRHPKSKQRIMDSKNQLYQGNKCLPLACQMYCSIGSIPVQPPVQSPNSITRYTEPASPARWPHTCPFPSHYTSRLGPASPKARPVSIGHIHPDSLGSECLDTCPRSLRRPSSRVPPANLYFPQLLQGPRSLFPSLTTSCSSSGSHRSCSLSRRQRSVFAMVP